MNVYVAEELNSHFWPNKLLTFGIEISLLDVGDQFNAV